MHRQCKLCKPWVRAPTTGRRRDGDAASAAPLGLLRLRLRMLDVDALCGSAHFTQLLRYAQGDAALAAALLHFFVFLVFGAAAACPRRLRRPS